MTTVLLRVEYQQPDDDKMFTRHPVYKNNNNNKEII